MPLVHTDAKPNQHFSTSGPYVLYSRQFPTGKLARIRYAIPGTDCFVVELECEQELPLGKRRTAYALRSELD